MGRVSAKPTIMETPISPPAIAAANNMDFVDELGCIVGDGGKFDGFELGIVGSTFIIGETTVEAEETVATGCPCNAVSISLA